MGVIRKRNPETGEWEVYGSSDAKDINLVDVGDNFKTKNVEGALREISTQISEAKASLEAYNNILTEHSTDIQWLKLYGGSGGGSSPTITSTFKDCIVSREEDVKIPIFFSSPNLGEGTAYVLIDNVEVMSVTGIKQGNNTINIGKLTNLNNEISIYVKDRTNALSNQLTWNVIAGGIDLEVTFDDTADYFITDIISMQFNISSASDEPILMHLTVDYDTYEVVCNQGFNEYTFENLGVGIHKISFYFTSGPYSTSVTNYNIIVVSSNSLYISSTFINGTAFKYGIPVPVQYRISKNSSEVFTVNMFIDGTLSKTVECTPGTYYWTINNLEVGTHDLTIEVSGANDETQVLDFSVVIEVSDYIPLKVETGGLLYRLSAKGRTNQDSDRELPIDNSGNNVITTLHNFNFYTNGWIDDELVCDGNAYVEIDLKPWENNALYGSTIEVQFTGLDIGLSDARIFDYTDVDDPYKGIFIDLENSKMKSLANTGEITLDKDEETTLTFVIDRANKFGKIYIDGICSRAFSLSDTGSGTNAVREDFTHSQKIYLNSKKGLSNFGACKIKDVRVYNRVLSDDEIVKNFISQVSDLAKQEELYNFNFHNTSLPTIRMYGDMTNMTLETPVSMRIKYTSPNEDKYGMSFDLPFCQVNWQGTSSLQYVLKNFTARLKDESLNTFEYTPYPNGILEDVYCFKCDYMESTHSRNVGIAKFVNDCVYDTKNPMQVKDPNIRNAVNGFPCILYINDELQGIYNFNLDRYSTKSFGYVDENSTLVYEVSANSDTTAGAFFSWSEGSGKTELDYYKSDFECLYPPTRAAGNDNMSELIRLIQWVDNSSDEDFKDNFGNYFNLEYVLRYYLTVLVFGLVDSLGKNMKLTSFDRGLTWMPQVYDADTSIGLDNTGFLKFDADIEMGDQNVFNTTGSRLWQRVVFLFQAELQEQYALMRQDRFTVDNIMKYLYGEQISQIPATYYNKDMQSKYLNFGSSYLYALHGSGEKHIRKWIRERIMYCDTLLKYQVSSSDYITLRSSKLGYVYLDIQTYIPMYVSVKWRDEVNNTGLQTKRVGRGETVRFEYNMPTATDQEIIVYAGYYLKSLGDVSNLQPTSMLIANASRLTEIECHSPNLINTDLSECTKLQSIDLSDCTALGTGIGAQPILNIQNCKYLRKCDCRNTQLTAIYTMQAGGNLEEIYYPSTIQVIQLTNQKHLRIAGVPRDAHAPKALAQVEITNCNNIEYLQYPYTEGEEIVFESFKYLQTLLIENSLDKLKTMSFKGFSKLKSVELSSLLSLEELDFEDMLPSTDEPTLQNILISNCPRVKDLSFKVSSDDYKIAFLPNGRVDIGGMYSLEKIECNTDIIGLDTLIIPTSLKELRFTDKFGTGKNDIKSIWSSSANHTSDGFVGMDLLDINLTYLDMSNSTIERGINFHISPIDQHPNLNTNRDGIKVPYFIPEGSMDLTNYEGDVEYLYKGLDFSKLKITTPPNVNTFIHSITGLFEGAKFSKSIIDVNKELAKYPNVSNWSNLFKNSVSDLEPSDVNIPIDRPMVLTSMFENTSVTQDIEIPSNVINVDSMFKNCKSMKKYKDNWDKTFDSKISHIDTYKDTGNDKIVPLSWGGQGYVTKYISEIAIEIPYNNYEFTLTDYPEFHIVGDRIISWGDGTEEILTDNYTHTYSKRGKYIISGNFLLGNNYEPSASMKECLTEVRSLAKVNPNLSYAFMGCTALKYLDCDTSHVTSLAYAFYQCSTLTELDLSMWKVDNVTSLYYTFHSCSSLEKLDLTGWNIKNVNTMRNTFYGCISLTSLDIGHWDVSKVKSMYYTFYNCKSLKRLDLSKWDTRLVEDVRACFQNCESLVELNVSDWKLDNITSLFYTFAGCSSLTSLDLSTWDITNVETLQGLFYNCISLRNIPIEDWNLVNVKSLYYTFYRCLGLTELDLSRWVVDNVNSLRSTFYGCSNLVTLNIGNWNTGNVTTLRSTFQNCNALENLDVSEWDVSQVEDLLYTFYNCESLTELNVNEWKVNNVKELHYTFAGCSALTTLDLNNWNIENVESINYTFYDCKSLLSLNIASWNTSKVTTLQGAFYNCINLIDLDVSEWDTRQVISLYYTFAGCSALTSIDLRKWDIGNVNTLYYTFSSCSSLVNLDLSTWDVTNVETIAYTFYACTNLTNLNIYNWNINRVASTAYCFYNCRKLESLDLSTWDLDDTELAQDMLYGCESLTNIEPPSNLMVSHGLSTSILLSKENILRWINKLPSVNTEVILTLGQTLRNKLTDEELLVAINKGWSII